MMRAAPAISTGTGTMPAPGAGMFPTGHGGSPLAAGPARALRYAESRQRDFLADLARFARFPTVSAEPDRAQDVAACARWLATRLRSVGLDRVGITASILFHAEMARLNGDH